MWVQIENIMAPGACSTECTRQMGSDTCVQRARCKTAESLDLSSVCVIVCVAPCFSASLRQKGSCKHIILLHSHVKLPNSAACTVVNPAVLPQAAAASAAAAATNASCQECFVTPPTSCCSGAFDVDEPRRRMDGVFGDGS